MREEERRERKKRKKLKRKRSKEERSKRERRSAHKKKAKKVPKKVERCIMSKPCVVSHNPSLALETTVVRLLFKVWDIIQGMGDTIQGVGGKIF